MQDQTFLRHSKPVKLLNQKEVAILIRKSPAWLERKRWEGGGPPYRKIGRHALYAEADILEWISSHPLITSTSEKIAGVEQ